MDAVADLGLLYRDFPLIGIVLYHVVDLLFASPWIWEGLPGLENKIFSYFVDEDHYLRRVSRAVDFSQIEALCAQRTPDRKGGIPPIPPLKLYKLYLVMFLFNIPSERELCRRAQADLAIRWFCGFGLLSPIPVHSTLSKFRARMGMETFERIFLLILCQCVAGGLVSGEEWIFDASKLLAAATPIAPHEQLRRLLRAFLEDLFDTAQVEPASEHDRQVLNEIIQKAAGLVRAKVKDVGRFWTRFEQGLQAETPPGEEPPQAAPAPIQVRFPTMKAQHIEERLKAVLSRIPHAVGDLDVRYGHTSDHEAFLGYLSSFGIDGVKQIITATVLTDGGTHCSKHFDALYSQHKENLRRSGLATLPERGLGDKGYDDASIRAALADDGVEVFIPPMDRQNKHGVYATDLFRFNEAGDLICPGECTMIPGARRDRKGGTVIYRCPHPDCAQRAACTKGKRRTVEINPDAYRLRQRALEQRETAPFKEAMKRRLLIEAVFGHGKMGHHLHQALYRNVTMARIQQLTAATSMNLEKLVTAKSSP